MFNGKNSTKEFEVINEDYSVIAEFDSHGQCVDFIKTVPWFEGKCNVRRDRSLSRLPEKCGWTMGIFMELSV